MLLKTLPALCNITLKLKRIYFEFCNEPFEFYDSLTKKSFFSIYDVYSIDLFHRIQEIIVLKQ